MGTLKETIVIDDLLTDSQYDIVEQWLERTPQWTFIKDMSYQGKQHYGFSLLMKHPDQGIVSNLYEIVAVPIINALLDRTMLSVKDITFCRSFLQVPLANYEGINGIHIDQDKPHYACVYYVNDADGDTIIFKETPDDIPFGTTQMTTVHQIVSPKKGRVVLFDGRRYHCSSQPRFGHRCIINFNLE